MQKVLLTLIFVNAILFCHAQSSFQPLGTSTYHLLDRFEIMNGTLASNYFTSCKPISKQNIGDLVSNLSLNKTEMKSKTDEQNFDWLIADNEEWCPVQNDFALSKKPILKVFYNSKADLYSHVASDFTLKINPVINFQIGKEQNDSSGRHFINTRGVEARGWINKKVGFYLFISENQMRQPVYVQQEVKKLQAVPGEGYYKEFKGNGVDFLSTTGYINCTAAKYINITFGNGKNFIGDGYRSLFLSDFSENYLFLRLNTKVWKFQYQNIFADLTANFHRTGDHLLARKYAAFHHLSFNATSHLNIGLFEGVVFGRNNGYELSYLNPIIFYRAVEQGLGSPDNAVMGADFKTIFLKHFSAYGQLLIDDLNISEFKKFDGYWADKLGGQIGIKYINAFMVSNLDLQLELNAVSPYTYTHNDTLANYSHYNQPLAHPLGANFKEWIGIINYQPLQQLTLQLKIFKDLYGQDPDSSNYGGNILIPTYEQTIEHINNNVIGQGIRTDQTMIDFIITYEVKHNFYIDAELLHRNATASDTAYNSLTNYLALGIRWNIAKRNFDF